MKKNVLTILEHETKSLELGGSFVLTSREINELYKLNKRLRDIYKTGTDILQVNVLPGRPVALKANSYVGVIRVGSKIIQIIPKIAKGEEGGEDYNRLAISNLLYMLSFTKKLSIKEADLASLKRVDGNFFEVLIYLFAKNLLSLIQNNVSKEYVTKEDNLPFIKGKLQFSDHIKLNSVTRTNFFLRYDEFCEDNLLNRIFKYAVHLLMNSSSNFKNLKLLQELQLLFCDISLQKVVAEDFKKVNLTRLNKVYEPVLNLAKIFINQSSLEMSADNISTFSFVFDMNYLFEEYVGEMIKRSCYDQYASITLQKPTKNLVEEKLVDGVGMGSVFNMRPDIVLGKNYRNHELIIDTKYKIRLNNDKKEGVSQADMYQMNAYSKKYDCPNIILLYPQTKELAEHRIDFKIDNKTTVKVRGVNLCRDLKIEREKFASELKEIVRCG